MKHCYSEKSTVNFLALSMILIVMHLALEVYETTLFRKELLNFTMFLMQFLKNGGEKVTKLLLHGDYQTLK